MRTINVNDKTQIVVEWKNARSGFKHTAALYVNGAVVDSVKINYINRTWELYEFESVIQKLLDHSKILTKEEKAAALKIAEAR